MTWRRVVCGAAFCVLCLFCAPAFAEGADGGLPRGALMTFLWLPALGLVTGYLAGLFGVGGGFIITPLLNVLLGIPMGIAVGSSLAQMVPVSLLAYLRHAKSGNADGKLAWCLAPGVIIGTFAGTLFLKHLESLGSITISGRETALVAAVLNAIFVVLLVSIAVRFFGDGRAEKTPAGPLQWQSGPWQITLNQCQIRCSLASLMVFGLVIGLMAGLLGIGGGVLIIPVLVCGFGVPVRVTIGTSAMILLFSSIAGTMFHLIGGHVDAMTALPLAVGSITGVNIGARHSLMLPVERLKKAFALLTLIVATIIVIRMFC